MKTLTKKESRQQDLARHYEALHRLAVQCGAKMTDGKKLSVKLLKLERIAHKAAENYCNGQDANGRPFEEQDLDTVLEPIWQEVNALFNDTLQGFFINTDPRGCALKIHNRIVTKYEKCGLFKDWGGYGLLAPEID